MKTLVFEVSQIKNLQYDIEKVSAKVEHVRPLEDIQCQVDNWKTDRQAYSKLAFEPYVSFTKKALLDITDKALSTQDFTLFRTYFGHSISGQDSSAAL